MTDTKTLDRLLFWLAGYVVVLLVVGWAAGKLTDLVPVITNLVSAFSGAAFAIMRVADGRNGSAKNG